MGNKAVESSMHKNLNTTKSVYPNIQHKEEKDVKTRIKRIVRWNIIDSVSPWEQLSLENYAFALPVKILRNFRRRVFAVYKDQLSTWTKKPNFDHNSEDVSTREY